MPDDTRALREDEREAMERASDAWEESAPLEDRHDEVVAFEAGFIAGLRYRDEAASIEVTPAAEALVRSEGKRLRVDADENGLRLDTEDVDA